MIVLIPAYEPDERLVELVRALDDGGHQMLVVDDGSGQQYAPIFADVEALGTLVLHQPGNTGKAAALRRGLSHIAAHWPGHDVVTADSDGQHRPEDIGAVAQTLQESGDSLVLGGRAFTGAVPVRSRFGNAVSRLLFRVSAGVSVHDTQTGLRGIPSRLIPEVLAVPGGRFAWEMNVLVHASRRGIPIREVPIATVYLEGNVSSHFRPIRDSAAVMRPLLRYLAVSLGSFLLDVVALQLLFAATGMLVLSVVGARMLSGAVNFTLNRAFVFHAVDGGSVRRQLVRYLLIALSLLAAGYAGIALLTLAGVPLLAAKLLTDAVVYAGGFLLQRGFVFANNAKKARIRRSEPSSFSVREGGLEPPRPIRALAPQASASTYSATRAGDEKSLPTEE